MPKKDPLDIINNSYGKFLILDFSHTIKSRNYYLIECDCGSISIMEVSSILNGSQTMCFTHSSNYKVKREFTTAAEYLQLRELEIGGNYTEKVELNSIYNSSHPLYATWKGLKYRCYNIESKNYHNYGGRGIIVCDRWLKSFQHFCEDMGERPYKHSIDRIDNDGDYEKYNCRWSNQKEQSNNTRISNWNRLLKEKKEKIKIKEWGQV